MLRRILKSKIHRATVTESNLNYEGSVSIDQTFMELANILPFEEVEIYNINNGERFSTYAIAAKPDSGIICINGAAARKAQPGDLVIIASFVHLTDEEYKKHSPKVIRVNSKNNLI